MKKGCLIALIVAVVLVLIIGLGMYSFVKNNYNNMVTLEENVTQKWAQVENVYQRRADLIPNLVEVVKGYAGHERETLEAVVNARSKVGGQINLAKEGTGRQGMAEIIRYLSHVLKKLQVPILTGVEVTRKIVLEKNPDVVIVTTGSRPKANPVPGDYGPPSVLNVREVIERQFPVGEKVLFIDENSGHHATATVELLADQGKKVDMVTSDLFVGIGLAPLGDLYLTRQRLLQKGVTFTTDVVIDEIDGSKVKARDIYTNQSILFEGYDTIVLDMGNMVNDRLYRQLKGQVKELYRAGDCVAPRGIDMAILEGRRLGERL